MLVQSVWPSDQAGKCFITLCRHDQDSPRRMPDGTTALIGNPRGSTPRLAGALWHERDPEVSSILVAAAREQFQQKRVAVLRPELPQNKEMEHDGDFLFSRKCSGNRRMLAGLQVARPSQDGRSDVQIIPSPSGGVAQQKRSCRSRRRCGECLRDYKDRAPALRKAGGRVFNPPLSGSSGRVAQYRLANLVAVFSGKTNECRITLGLAVRIRPAVSADSPAGTCRLPGRMADAGRTTGRRDLRRQVSKDVKVRVLPSQRLRSGGTSLADPGRYSAITI